MGIRVNSSKNSKVGFSEVKALKNSERTALVFPSSPITNPPTNIFLGLNACPMSKPKYSISIAFANSIATDDFPQPFGPSRNGYLPKYKVWHKNSHFRCGIHKSPECLGGLKEEKLKS